MAGDTITQYLDDDGNPVGAGSDVKPPKGYSLLTSKKSPAAPNKKASVKELKILAAAKKPIVPPPGYIPEASVSAYTPSFLEQARSVVANSAVGHSLEEALPRVADALHLRPTETIGTPQAAQHKEQLLAPEYLAPALTEAIRTGPLMGAPAPPEGRAPDATSNRIEGALTAAGGLTSGKSMATMGGIAAAAGLTAGVINPASAQVLSRLISGGFTLDMLHGLYQQHKEYRKAVDAGDINEAQKIQGEMGVTGIMALLTGKHALTNHPFTPVTETPVRERTNVLHRNTAGEVRQAKGQAPTVWLSPDAWKSFMGSLYPGEDAAATHGVNLPANADLHSFANDPQLAAAHPAFGDVQQLLAKAHENAGEGGVAIANTRPSIQSNVNVIREELNHTWQRGLANGNVTSHLKPEAFTDLHQAIPQGMQDHLVDQGYDGTSAPEMVTEAAAKLMDGRPERYGTTPDEAVDFLDKYFKHVTEQHGAKALEELHHVRGIAADAKARAITEHSGSGAGQDNSAVPSVAAGGQGGPAEGVPAAGGEVNGNPTQAVQASVSSPEATSGTGVSPEIAGLDPAFNREQVKTPEFKKWFGKSKVVDEDGKPKVVYHGTDADFDAFRKDKLGHATNVISAMRGFFFTDSTEVARGYADHAALDAPVKRAIDKVTEHEQAGNWDAADAATIESERLDAEIQKNRARGQNIIPAYLTLKNPASMDAKGKSFFGDLDTKAEIHRIIEKARRDGNDGVIFNNLDDHPGRDGDVSTHYLVFEPTQIKSAIGNSGAFDPKDPNILRNREKVEDDKEDDTPSAEQDAPTSLDVNTNTEGDGGQEPEQVEASTGTGLATIIPIQGGTQLASAPKQEPVVKVHTSVPHQTTRTVSVPLQTAIPDAPVVTTRVLPLAQLKAMAAGLNPQRQPKSVREIMEEAKARMGNSIVP